MGGTLRPWMNSKSVAFVRMVTYWRDAVPTGRVRFRMGYAFGDSFFRGVLAIAVCGAQNGSLSLSLCGMPALITVVIAV